MAKQPVSEQIRSLQERSQRLQSKIRQIEVAERKRDQERRKRREALVGAVVLELVERGEWPRETLWTALDKHLGSPRDRELFALPTDAVRTPDPDSEAESTVLIDRRPSTPSSGRGVDSAAPGPERLQGSAQG
jgi:hypothetical protein